MYAMMTGAQSVTRPRNCSRSRSSPSNCFALGHIAKDDHSAGHAPRSVGEWRGAALQPPPSCELPGRTLQLFCLASTSRGSLLQEQIVRRIRVTVSAYKRPYLLGPARRIASHSAQIHDPLRRPIESAGVCRNVRDDNAIRHVPLAPVSRRVVWLRSASSVRCAPIRKRRPLRSHQTIAVKAAMQPATRREAPKSASRYPARCPKTLRQPKCGRYDYCRGEQAASHRCDGWSVVRELINPRSGRASSTPRRG